MAVPRTQLRYIVTGTLGKKTYREDCSNGRDAYIIDSWLRRQGYENVTITIKNWQIAPERGLFF